MKRMYIDCREFPGEIKCSVALAADTEEELMEAAVQHAVAVHRLEDNDELRKDLRTCFRVGTPPVQAPKPAGT